MGAEVLDIFHGVKCAHGCRIGGECPTHMWKAWYREGTVYLVRDGEQDYRKGIPLEVDLYDAIRACQENHL